MGVNPKNFKTGGFLNGKDVTLTGYQFQRKTFETADGPFTPQSIELRFRIDGADEDVKTYLKMGQADNWGDQSPDGLRLFTPDGQNLSNNSQLGIFLQSFVPAGAPADIFDADDSPAYLSLESVVSRRPRFRIATPVNAEKTERLGPEKGRGKNLGKTFDRRDTVVEKFYGYTAKGQAGVPQAVGTMNGPAAGVDRGVAVTTLLGIAKAAGGAIPKGKLPTKVSSVLRADPNLEGYRKLICGVAFLEGLDVEKDGLSYDAETQTVQVV